MFWSKNVFNINLFIIMIVAQIASKKSQKKKPQRITPKGLSVSIVD